MLILSDATWKQLLALLATSTEGVERVAYLDGIRNQSHLADATDAIPVVERADLVTGVVTTITVPNAVQSAGHFTVSAPEMSRAGAHLRQHGLVRLAQVHTHPGHDTPQSHRRRACL